MILAVWHCAKGHDGAHPWHVLDKRHLGDELLLSVSIHEPAWPPVDEQSAEKLSCQWCVRLLQQRREG